MQYKIGDREEVTLGWPMNLILFEKNLTLVFLKKNPKNGSWGDHLETSKTKILWQGSYYGRLGWIKTLNRKF